MGRLKESQQYLRSDAIGIVSLFILTFAPACDAWLLVCVRCVEKEMIDRLKEDNQQNLQSVNQEDIIHLFTLPSSPPMLSTCLFV